MGVSLSEIEVWKKIIYDCEIVFDVGCRDDNTFYEINPNLKEIHLFDPHVPEHFIEEIKKYDNIYLNEVAVGNDVNDIEFHYNYGSILHRTEEPKFNGKHQTKIVKQIKLIDYIREKNIEKIDFLKIDTEGYDFEVIKGIEDFIVNIKYIQFEEFNIYYDGKLSSDIHRYFDGWNIYDVGGSPLNYLVTKENIDYLRLII